MHMTQHLNLAELEKGLIILTGYTDPDSRRYFCTVAQ
jgi:hypothetical protein